MSNPIQTSPVAMFSRLFDPEKIDLPADAAEALLRVAFDEGDHQRMHELAARNQEGQLTADEKSEFDNFLLVGNLLSVMHARARMCLKTVESAS